MSTVYGSGSATVEVEDRTPELVRAVVDRVAPGALDLIRVEVRRIHASAHSRWPVGRERKDRTYHSREALGWEVRIDNLETLRGRVFNTAPWSRYIKPKGLKGKSAFVELLRKPLRERADHIVMQLGSLVRDELERI